MSETPPKPVLYADREDWKDVTPLEQSDLENPLVPIFYPMECECSPVPTTSRFTENLQDKDAMDYFRGIVAIKEHSDRVLQLTEHIIRMNPAHYSIWYEIISDIS